MPINFAPRVLLLSCFTACVSLSLAQKTASEWENKAKQLSLLEKYKEAGDSYIKTAQAGGGWANLCFAADMFLLSGKGYEDLVLRNARECILNATSEKDFPPKLSTIFIIGDAHTVIAVVLNQRGVFEEALRHADEALALRPSYSFAFFEKGAALLGLRRFAESITASKQALRLEDGKLSRTHFQIGGAYFQLEEWSLAKQSFEKAAEMDPSDPFSAFNVALCFIRLNLYVNATVWLKEASRRDPTFAQQNDIPKYIRNIERYR